MAKKKISYLPRRNETMWHGCSHANHPKTLVCSPADCRNDTFKIQMLKGKTYIACTKCGGTYQWGAK